MAYPADVQTQVISIGRAIDWWGEPPSITAVVTPILGGAKQFVHKATLGLIVARPKTFRSETPGLLDLSVPKVIPSLWSDGTSGVARPWGYRIDVRLEWSDGNKAHEYSREFSPEPDQDLIDLESVPLGEISTAVYGPIPAVTSVNGQTGAVVLATGDGGGSVDLSGYATVEDLEPLARSADVTEGLASKATVNHTHPDLLAASELADGLAGKADAAHTHPSADVVGLEDALSSKADAAHTHPDIEQRIMALEEAPAGGSVTLVESPAGSGLYEIQGV